MRVYQLDSKLKKTYYNIDFKGIKNEVDLVKRVIKNRDNFMYDKALNCIGVYIVNIPKKICKYNELTIIIDNNGTRYFSGLCN